MNEPIPVEAVSTRSGPSLGGLLRRLRVLRSLVTDHRTRQNEAIEASLGIDTRANRVESVTRDAQFADSVHYEALDYPLLRNYLGHLDYGPSDVAFDIGCGAGRMLCELARAPIAKAIGIELSPELAALAQKNVETLQGRMAEVEVRQGDATSADYGAGTIYALYNPFGAETMAATLDAIQRSLRERPRPIQIIYINPVCKRLFDDATWLRQTALRRSAWSRIEAVYYSNGVQ